MVPRKKTKEKKLLVFYLCAISGGRQKGGWFNLCLLIRLRFNRLSKARGVLPLIALFTPGGQRSHSKSPFVIQPASLLFPLFHTSPLFHSRAVLPPLLTLPTGAHRQLHVDLRRVDGPVVSHQVGVIGHPVHVERHHGELHVDDVVVPLFVANLQQGPKPEALLLSAAFQEMHYARIFELSLKKKYIYPSNPSFLGGGLLLRLGMFLFCFFPGRIMFTGTPLRR